jgi:ribosome assembly protein YihI (activator of Der GTPase)
MVYHFQKQNVRNRIEMPAGLSFEDAKNARPIAVVVGGDMDGDVLYLHESAKKSSKSRRVEVPAHKYHAALKHWKKNSEKAIVIDKIERALNNEKPLADDESEEVKALLKRIQEDMETLTEVEIPDDSLFQLIPNPNPRQRDTFYICGPSGAGKSHIAKGIAQAYRKLHPGREVYLVSKLAEDSTLDSMKGGKPKRINVQSLVDDPFDIEEARDSLVIVDDIDALPKDQLKAVHTFIDDIAITGRHTNTSLLFLTHYTTNYKSTRLILMETHHFVVYPQTTSKHALMYLLRNHAGIDDETITKMRKCGSRWVCISKGIPPIMIGQHFACLLNQD